jgi:hypothetical protein
MSKGKGVSMSGNKRWVAKVKTDSTHPAPGLFTRSASAIARALASKRVSPKGPQSGMRMLNYFINRGGKGLSSTRRKELERAKKLLSERIRKKRGKIRRGKLNLTSNSLDVIPRTTESQTGCADRNAPYGAQTRLLREKRRCHVA